MLGKIQDLLPVLDIAFQAEQVKMSHIMRRIEALKQQLRDLDRPVSDQTLSAATRAGADVRWETWVHSRKASIIQEIAIASRDREQAKVALIAALSKREAAVQMQTKAQTQLRQIAERRSSW